MLSNTSKLYFPKLSFEKSVELVAPNGTKTMNLYSLDWTRKENHCASDKYTGLELTVEYETKIKSLRFAIPDAYIKEIRRMSWQSVSEWNSIRLIDDSMKKIYLHPAASLIETSFKLMIDCLYDSNSRFFYRENDKEFLLTLLLFKFWKNQTKTQMIIEFSKINEIMDTARMYPELESEIAKFIEFIKLDLKVDSWS